MPLVGGDAPARNACERDIWTHGYDGVAIVLTIGQLVWGVCLAGRPGVSALTWYWRAVWSGHNRSCYPVSMSRKRCDVSVPR